MHHWNRSISLWPSPPGRHCFVSRSPLESSRQGPGGKRGFVELKRQRERESYLGRKNTQVGTSWHKPTQARLASLYQSSAPLASAHDVRTSFTMFYMSSCLDMFGILWLYCSDLQVKYAKLPMLATKIPRSVQSFVLDRMAKPELPGREVL